MRLLHNLLGLGAGVGNDLLRLALGLRHKAVGLGTALFQPLLIEFVGQLLKFRISHGFICFDLRYLLSKYIVQNYNKSPLCQNLVIFFKIIFPPVCLL